MSTWEEIGEGWFEVFSCEHRMSKQVICAEVCSHMLSHEEWMEATNDDGEAIFPRCLCETHYKALVERETPVTIGTLWARIKARYLR